MNTSRKIVCREGVFAALPADAVERLTASARVIPLADGDVVFRQNDPTTAFFIVTEGMLKLYRLTGAGDEVVIQILGRGDSVAAASAFAGSRYFVTAEAIGKASVIRIPTEHVIRCMRESPDIALAVVSATSQHLGHLIRHVEDLKIHSGFQRVAEFLASLCRETGGSCTVKLPYDKVVIAGRLGIKPESLSRAFAKLRSIGIAVRGSSVTIRNVAALRRLAADGRRRPLANWDYHGDDAAAMREQGSDRTTALLRRRMAALRINAEQISRAAPGAFRDLRKVCVACECKGRCLFDLAGDSQGRNWLRYCANAASLSELVTPH